MDGMKKASCFDLRYKSSQLIAYIYIQCEIRFEFSRNGAIAVPSFLCSLCSNVR